MADEVIERMQREVQARTAPAAASHSAVARNQPQAREFLDIHAGGKVTSFPYSSLSFVEIAEDQSVLALEFFGVAGRRVTVTGALLMGLRDRVKAKVEEAITVSPRSAADIPDMPVVLSITVKEA